MTRQEIIAAITAFDPNMLYNRNIATAVKSNRNDYSYGFVGVVHKTILHEGAEFKMNKIEKLTDSELLKALEEIKYQLEVPLYNENEYDDGY